MADPRSVRPSSSSGSTTDQAAAAQRQFHRNRTEHEQSLNEHAKRGIAEMQQGKMDRIEGIATGDTGLQTKGLAETASGIVKQDTAHILPGVGDNRVKEDA